MKNGIPEAASPHRELPPAAGDQVAGRSHMHAVPAVQPGSHKVETPLQAKTVIKGG